MMHIHSNHPSHQQHHSEESSPQNMNMGIRSITKPMQDSNGNGQMESMEDRMRILHMRHEIVTGFIGFIVSGYLVAYQFDYLDGVWDPFPGGNIDQVLNSSMSPSLNVSDVRPGSLDDTFEFLTGCMSSPSIWSVMPWMLTFFGVLVIPLGFVHIFLVTSQPLAVGAWCFFCLIATGIMLPSIPLEVDKVVAMAQHMVQARHNGEKFWTVFGKGKPVEKNKDECSPQLMSLNNQFGKVFKASVLPWTLPVFLTISVALVILSDKARIPLKSSFADINHLCLALGLIVAALSVSHGLVKSNMVYGLNN